MPQGSILGLLLFIIFLNYIFDNTGDITANVNETLLQSIKKNNALAESNINNKFKKAKQLFVKNNVTSHFNTTSGYIEGCYRNKISRYLNTNYFIFPRTTVAPSFA